MALHTITAFTTTQNPADTTYKVSFGFTATDSDSDTLALSYDWKKQSDSVWTSATTTAPYSVNATGAGVAVSGVWDLDTDYFGNDIDVPVTLRVSASRAAIAATGTLTAVAANATTGIKEGDSFVVGGRTYEFTTDVAVTAGRVPVVLATATDTAAQVKAAIILAINTDTLATVTASSGSGNVVNLVAKTAGVASNVAITQSISNSATLTPVGMANGADVSVVTATSNITVDTGNGDLLPVDAAPTTESKFNFTEKVIEGRSEEYGAVSQGSFFGSQAKKILNTVGAGTRDFARIYADRNFRTERAVLVNPTFFDANIGSSVFTVVTKPVAWLTDIAGNTLSSDKVWANDTIYAVVQRQVKSLGNASGLLVQQNTPVIAYLMSAVQFENMVG